MHALISWPNPSSWCAIGLELLGWLLGRRRRYRVTGESMIPTLLPGDHLLVDERAYHHRLPVKGDIVVVRHPSVHHLVMTKRVIGCDAEGVWVGSDHPDVGTDSRHFGPVSRSRLIGRVTACLRSE